MSSSPRPVEMELEDLRSVAGLVSRETYDRLLRFERAVEKWNARINLVGASTVNDIWRRHILDSAQLLPLAPDDLRWLDLGSGGGFPGLVIGILLMDRRGGHIN